MTSKKPTTQQPATDTELIAGELVNTGTKAPANFDELRALVLGSDDTPITDTDEIERRLFERMINAASLDELLTPATVTKSEDVLDRPMTLHAVHFNESDFADGTGLYAIMDVTLDGKREAVACGARTVCHQLLVMLKNEWLPARVQLWKSDKPTKSGYYPMELRAAAPEEEPF